MSQLPRRSLLGMLAGGFVAFLVTPATAIDAAATPQIRAGDACKKVGRRRTVGAKTFECVDEAGVRQWKRVRTPAKPQQPTTSEVKVLESSALALGRSQNTIVNTFVKGKSTNYAVVLTRTPSGVAAFSRICTHQGSLVCTPEDDCGKEQQLDRNQLGCPSHGAVFNASTGAVIEGPATRPLTQFRAVERGGSIYLVF